MRSSNIIFKNISQFRKDIKNIKIGKSDNLMFQIYSGISNESLLLNIINELKVFFPQSGIIGATTDGEIYENNIVTDEIVINYTIFKDATFTYAYSKNKNCFDCGIEIGESLVNVKEKKVIFSFAEGLSCNTEEYLNGLQEVLKGETIVTGGLAGDNTTCSQTFLILNNKVYKEGAVALAISSKKLHVSFDYAFSWKPIGEKLTITKSDFNRVYEIDNIPAADIYGNYLGKDIQKLLPKVGIEFPLVIESDSHKTARAVIGKEKDKSLIFAGNLPVGTKVRFGIGDMNNILENSKNIYKHIASLKPEVIFSYSCMERRRFLDKLIIKDVESLASTASLSGFFTYGEFATIDKQYILMNQTATVCSLSEKGFSKGYCNLPSHNESIEKTNTFTALSNLVNSITTKLEHKVELEHKLVDDWVIITDTDARGVITYASKAYCDIMKCEASEIIGRPHRIHRHPEMSKKTFEDMWFTLKQGKQWSGDVLNMNEAGEDVWFYTKIAPNFNEDGTLLGYTAIRQNITQQKELERISIVDELTGLYNRRYFNEVIKNVVNETKKNGKQLSFAIYDIDNFKKYNDNYGHQMGDIVLETVAKELKEHFQRESDHIFRLGGEEFAVIIDSARDMQNKTSKILSLFKESIQRIESLGIDHQYNDNHNLLTISCGLSIDNKDLNEDQIYKCADDFLYKAKKSGRNRIVVDGN